MKWIAVLCSLCMIAFTAVEKTNSKQWNYREMMNNGAEHYNYDTKYKKSDGVELAIPKISIETKFHKNLGTKDNRQQKKKTHSMPEKQNKHKINGDKRFYKAQRDKPAWRVSPPLNRTIERCPPDPCCQNGKDVCFRDCICEGEKGGSGLTGPPGFPGLPGAIGPDGPPGSIGADGFPGPPGPPGPTGFKGVPGAIGVTGPTGPDGPNGPPGRPGPRGLSCTTGDIGDMGMIGDPGVGIPGIDGPMGIDGLPGPIGLPGIPGIPGPPGVPGLPGCKGEPSKCDCRGSGKFIYTYHFQEYKNLNFPLNCPKGIGTPLWQGYSFLHSEDDGRAHVQDLGDSGSCRPEFDPMPFMFCDNTGTCMHSRRTSSSFWLSIRGAIDKGSQPFNKKQADEYISRCVVCEVDGPVIAVHDHSPAIDRCTSVGYIKLWDGKSYMMHSVGAMAGGQPLGSAGSCLQYNENMFIECNGRDDGVTSRDDAGDCHIFSDKFNYWIYNFNDFSSGGATIPKFSGTPTTDYISDCSVCVGI